MKTNQSTAKKRSKDELVKECDPMVRAAAKGDQGAITAIVIGLGGPLHDEAVDALGEEHRQHSADVLQELFLALTEGKLEVDAEEGRALEWMFGVLRGIAERYVTEAEQAQEAKATIRIEARTAIGERCMTYEQAAQMYELVHDALRDGHPVEINFSGVRVITPSFLNGSVGRLYADIPEETVEVRLRLVNLNRLSRELVSMVLANSKRFYETAAKSR